MNSKLPLIILLIFCSSAFAEKFGAKDENKDGYLSKKEFAGDDERLIKKFEKLDKDSSNSLCKDEYADFYTKDKKDKKKGKRVKEDKEESKSI